MEKIFYATPSAFSSSTSAIVHILKEYFGIANPTIDKTENGKPYLKTPTKRLFFSLSHTKTHLFIAFSDENVGIDAEKTDREVAYAPLLKKFPFDERETIGSTEDFLRHWTVKEAAVKWLGGTLAHDLKKLRFLNGRLFYEQLELPVCATTLRIADCFVSVCSERDFSNPELIQV